MLFVPWQVSRQKAYSTLSMNLTQTQKINERQMIESEHVLFLLRIGQVRHDKLVVFMVLLHVAHHREVNLV